MTLPPPCLSARIRGENTDAAGKRARRVGVGGSGESNKRIATSSPAPVRPSMPSCPSLVRERTLTLVLRRRRMCCMLARALHVDADAMPSLLQLLCLATKSSPFADPSTILPSCSPSQILWRARNGQHSMRRVHPRPRRRRRVRLRVNGRFCVPRSHKP